MMYWAEKRRGTTWTVLKVSTVWDGIVEDCSAEPSSSVSIRVRCQWIARRNADQIERSLGKCKFDQLMNP